MISNEDIKLLEDLSLDKIEVIEFENDFSSELSNSRLLSMLTLIVSQRDTVLLRAINSYFFKTSFIPESCEVYSKLLIEEWHNQHDDIASILQFHLKCPSSTRYFQESINLKFSYLFKSDDFEPYVTKCMWGIAKMGSEYSKEVLLELSCSKDEVIKKSALEQVQRLGLQVQ